ncbi:ABC transporter permease [Pseudothermotoga sp. U03pept]|uniref:ABC transporter permease n=1 Tax=Pseudothermotoga sp. U03pept TaxID=3447012 RepID=UPI003F031616
MTDLVFHILGATLNSATPIMLAALGGMFTYYANIFNIAMEGMMLMGAFFAVYGSYFFGSWAVGILFAVLSGVSMALLFALFAIYLHCDEFITGIGINMVALGWTTYALRSTFKVKGALISPRIIGLPRWQMPFFHKMPFLETVFSNHPFVLYLAFGLAFVLDLLIFSTKFGLRLRATGEDPETAKSAGINPAGVKLLSTVFCGILSAMAGVYLSLGYVTLFSENMSNGRGWISLAIIILVKGRPLSILGLSLVFGFFESVGLILQHYKLAPQFASMIPYLATLFVLYVYGKQRHRTEW